MKNISTLTLLVSLVIGSAAASTQPMYYQVRGSLTEHLNVRLQPNSESKDIGNLQPGARPFEILEIDASGDWGRIPWQETTGWVALKYMEAIQLPHLAATIVPIGLLCAGAEPFWTLEIESAESVIFNTQEADTPMVLFNKAISSNGADLPIALELLAQDHSAVTILDRQACSDGMTNINYSWTADIIIQPELRLLSGCCVLR